MTDERGVHLDRQRPAVFNADRPDRRRSRPRRTGRRGRTPARRCHSSSSQLAPTVVLGVTDAVKIARASLQKRLHRAALV